MDLYLSWSYCSDTGFSWEPETSLSQTVFLPFFLLLQLSTIWVKNCCPQAVGQKWDSLRRLYKPVCEGEREPCYSCWKKKLQLCTWLRKKSQLIQMEVMVSPDQDPCRCKVQSLQNEEGKGWPHIQFYDVSRASDYPNTPVEATSRLRPLHRNKNKTISSNWFIRYLVKALCY